MRAAHALLLPFFVVACLRPAEERAEQDQQIGRAEVEGVRVEVEGGHAAVWSLADDALALWANAPRLQIALTWQAGAPDAFTLDVRNCMPGAELTFLPALGGAAATATLLSSERDALGGCHFRLGGLAGLPALSFGVAPPDTGIPGAFQFAVLSDVQEAIDRVQDIYRRIAAEPGVEFLLGAGDLTERGTAAQLERFQHELEQLPVPYYTTLGNHELGQSPTLFHHYFGRGSQSFDYRGVRFTLLDSASATIDPIVLDWLDTWLAEARSQLHVVAMHIPPLDPFGVRNGAFASRNEAADLLGRLAGGGVDLTLYGHIHSYYRFENAGIPAHISGGGGAIPERFDHIGRHFLVVDADPLRSTLSVRVVRVD
jgi:Icc protein